MDPESNLQMWGVEDERCPYRKREQIEEDSELPKLKNGDLKPWVISEEIINRRV